MEFSYTIDDRIAGVSGDLIQVDKKRAEEINKLRVSATEEKQFFNFEKDFVVGKDDMNAKGGRKDEPRWRKDDTNKKSALENLEKLSQVLEEENRLLEEKAVKELENETRPTESGDLILLTATEGHVHLAPIAYIFLILYILYITIGMGRTYLNK